jgi:asparagine synthase (glutamine-hydrolysing)
MCGITGFISRERCGARELEARVTEMSNQLIHRGPDDDGTWTDPSHGVALGFRRLAIVDLSSTGHQPMASASGRFVIVFNGEVYNFLGLRSQLEAKGHRFRGNSDTEVMLAAITEWGLEPAVGQFVGMFAFALWDRQERTLHLVRDRLGIKPLYYGWSDKAFLFASELKALRANRAFVAEVNPDALALYFRYQYIPQPHSIYKGVCKLPPGCILSLRADQAATPSQASVQTYWSAADVATTAEENQFTGTEQEAVDTLDALLRESIRLRMIADVPLGAFLSGGIDSTTVVALMQAQSTRPVKTFTVGFHEDAYNEARHAKEVAAHLGTDHTELYLSSGQAFDIIPKLSDLYDEPLSDCSQIPTFLVSRLARQQVTVSLSGDGGDELFGGYHLYFLSQSIWNKIGWLPTPARYSVATMLQLLPPQAWSRVFKFTRPLLPSAVSRELRGDRVHKLANAVRVRSRDEFYKQMVSFWPGRTRLVVGAQEPNGISDIGTAPPALGHFVQRMMFRDLVSYLPDDILAKVDRASMGVSLEARVPMLDHRVVEFAARLPMHLKVRGHTGKWLLRQLLYRYVPESLVERPKMGFGIPLGTWLRGPLREWAEDLLDETSLRNDGYLQPKPVRQLWHDHLAADRDWGAYLWTVLMFQSWRRRWMRSEASQHPFSAGALA